MPRHAPSNSLVTGGAAGGPGGGSKSKVVMSSQSIDVQQQRERDHAYSSRFLENEVEQMESEFLEWKAQSRVSKTGENAGDMLQDKKSLYQSLSISQL